MVISGCLHLLHRTSIGTLLCDNLAQVGSMSLHPRHVKWKTFGGTCAFHSCFQHGSGPATPPSTSISMRANLSQTRRMPSLVPVQKRSSQPPRRLIGIPLIRSSSKGAISPITSDLQQLFAVSIKELTFKFLSKKGQGEIRRPSFVVVTHLSPHALILFPSPTRHRTPFSRRFLAAKRLRHA